jgi:hypothetical protein
METTATMAAVMTEATADGRARRQRIASWVLQVLVAVILFQTLFFKFTRAEESIYIFSTLGLEPWGRIGSGIAELIAVVLLLVPRTVVFGAALSLAVISGAIVSHLTRLGIVVKDDGGLLFALAIVVFLGSTGVLALRRTELARIVGRLTVGGMAKRSAAMPASHSAGEMDS